MNKILYDMYHIEECYIADQIMLYCTIGFSQKLQQFLVAESSLPPLVGQKGSTCVKSLASIKYRALVLW